MKICCPRCRGEGKVELATLSKPLRECYALLAQLGPSTREAVHKASKSRLGLTMTYRRVFRLEQLGLVKPLSQVRPVRFQVV